jgi:hypothetical protein
MKLKSWSEFRAGMAGCLTQFDPVVREHVLIALYHRAWQREWLEGIREDVKTKAPQLHAERIRVGRLRKRLQKAIKAVRKENRGGNQGYLVRDYVGEAILGLERAARELQILDSGFAARIHPALRTKKENAVASRSAPVEIWSVFPGFGIAKIDQMFIQWMSDYLEILVTPRGKRLSSEKINEIIVATLQMAYGERITTHKVKMARRRLRQKPQ